MIQTRPLCSLLLPWTLFSLSAVSVTESQSTSHPQNIEVYYPYSPPTPPLSPPPPPPSQPPPSPLPLPPSPPPSVKTSSGSNKTIAKAVAATAASTVVVLALLFFVLRRRAMSRRLKGNPGPRLNGGLPGRSRDGSSRLDGNVKGLIVDENGLDVLYWRKLQGSKSSSPRQRSSFKRPGVVIGSPRDRGEGQGEAEEGLGRRIHEVPLLIGKSSTSERNSLPARPQAGLVSLKPPEATTSAAIQISNATAAPPPPPPPPPITGQIKNPTPPPPPPAPTAKPGGVASSLGPPPPPAPKISADKASGSSSGEGRANQVKLKPLHWDKVNVEQGNSMVWNKIEGGSFKVDDDLMEALFGYVATNRKSPKESKNSSSLGNLSPGKSGQIFILDIRKSQNIAIVLKSLSVSRKDILDALVGGRGLDMDTLEKLNWIALTEEEELQILGFGGDPTRLANAESFLFHILKAIPSAFTRFSAMHFKLNFDSEILQVRESIQTVELGCKELRTRGLFMKLLEAILKAGNRMNAGTSRGNAQAFNLSALKKLSDVKSTDGKTTLLHFVVKEVVRSEGRRCAISRTHSMSPSGSVTGINSENPREDKEKEYIMLGLPVVGGLSAEFSNVKKAACIDYESFAGSCEALQSRVSEIRNLVSRCEEDDRGGFAREMRGFLESAEAGIASLRKDQARAVELVKATTEYYQAGASKEKNPIRIFVIISDFLRMVDLVCVEIARNAQKKKPAGAAAASSEPDTLRKTMRFPKLPPNFLSDNKSSESDDKSSESDGDS